MTITTPDFESDLVARIHELLPADFVIEGDATNLRAGREFEVGGQTAQASTWVEFITERQHTHNNGQKRWIDLQVLHRYDARDRDADVAAKALMRRVYDALHQSGDFEGASGALYDEIRCLDGPAFLEPHYRLLNVTLWYGS